MKSLLLLAVLMAGCSSVPSAPPRPAIGSATPGMGSSAPATTPVPSDSAVVTPSPIVLPTFAQISAAPNGVVWALVAGNHLFRSQDRGDTWEERPLPLLPGGPGEVSFVNERQGWLVAQGSPATQCMLQAIAISYTRDAGVTWERLPATGIDEHQCKGSVAFVDSNRGFLSAWDPNHAPVIYRTIDGGRTWAGSQPLPDPPGFTTRGAGFALRAGSVRAFGRTLLVQAGGISDGEIRTYVFRSTDGGASWNHVSTAPLPAEQIVFVTASRWLQIGGRAHETTDGGATWHLYASDYDQAAPVAPEVVFGDEQVGYATVRGSIRRTIDGGAHWTQLRTPGTG